MLPVYVEIVIAGRDIDYFNRFMYVTWRGFAEPGDTMYEEMGAVLGQIGGFRFNKIIAQEKYSFYTFCMNSKFFLFFNKNIVA